MISEAVFCPPHMHAHTLDQMCLSKDRHTHACTHSYATLEIQSNILETLLQYSNNMALVCCLRKTRSQAVQDDSELTLCRRWP